MSRYWRKSWIGSGNAGRNTTIIRSNYLMPGNIPFYEWSMKLWEGLEQDLNYNTMVSQRGVLNLYHSDLQRDVFARRGNAMRCMALMPSFWTANKSALWCLILSLRIRAFRSTADCCSGAAARHATMRWCGDTLAGLTGAASMSCKIARSPAFKSRQEG